MNGAARKPSSSPIAVAEADVLSTVGLSRSLTIQSEATCTRTCQDAVPNERPSHTKKRSTSRCGCAGGKSWRAMRLMTYPSCAKAAGNKCLAPPGPQSSWMRPSSTHAPTPMLPKAATPMSTRCGTNRRVTPSGP
eukprot:6941121-Prymnesium_polylepis.2